MSKHPDMLRFTGGPAGEFQVGWTGPWPPPDYLTVAVGTESGTIKVVPEGIDHSFFTDVPSIKLVTYVRRNASTLGDDVEHPHLFRGADYVPDQSTLQ